MRGRPKVRIIGTQGEHIAYGALGWGDESDKTITLATDQQVSADFYEWAITGGNLVASQNADCLTFTGESSDFTLQATRKCWSGTLEWSTDHTTWTTLTGTEAMQSVNKKLYLRGKGNTAFVEYGEDGAENTGVVWRLSARTKCYGNIQTLLDWETPPTNVDSECYLKMFYGCGNLITAPELPATTLSDDCYKMMFDGCTGLVAAPELPATTVAYGCYRAMFADCTNLITAPELPATTVESHCYMSMFSGCTALTSAPELPATTLKHYCYYYMFSGCRALKINESSGNKIFTYSTAPEEGLNPIEVSGMFNNTGGSFTGTPKLGNTYYWTE